MLLGCLMVVKGVFQHFNSDFFRIQGWLNGIVQSWSVQRLQDMPWFNENWSVIVHGPKLHNWFNNLQVQCYWGADVAWIMTLKIYAVYWVYGMICCLHCLICSCRGSSGLHMSAIPERYPHQQDWFKACSMATITYHTISVKMMFIAYLRLMPLINQTRNQSGRILSSSLSLGGKLVLRPLVWGKRNELVPNHPGEVSDTRHYLEHTQSKLDFIAMISRHILAWICLVDKYVGI